MTTSQYINIIKNITKKLSDTEKKNPQTLISSIFKARGTSFLEDDDVSKIKAVLSTNDYLAWEECNAYDAQTAANNGFATVAVSDDDLFLIRPMDQELETEELPENVVTIRDIVDRNIENVSYYATGEGLPTSFSAPIPNRIAQNKSDPQWNANLWKYNGTDYTSLAASGCAVACISMALSCIGVNKTPGQLIKENGGGVYINNWNSFSPGSATVINTNTTNAVAEALNRYRYNYSSYAPPIVQVRDNNSGGNHYAVVCYYNTSKGQFLAVDPGYNGYDRTNGKVRYYYWSPKAGQQVIQYRWNA